MLNGDRVFEFDSSPLSPTTCFAIRVQNDGSLDVDVGAEYGGVLPAADARRLALAILDVVPE